MIYLQWNLSYLNHLGPEVWKAESVHNNLTYVAQKIMVNYTNRIVTTLIEQLFHSSINWELYWITEVSLYNQICKVSTFLEFYLLL